MMSGDSELTCLKGRDRKGRRIPKRMERDRADERGLSRCRMVFLEILGDEWCF